MSSSIQNGSEHGSFEEIVQKIEQAGAVQNWPLARRLIEVVMGSPPLFLLYQQQTNLANRMCNVLRILPPKTHTDAIQKPKVPLNGNNRSKAKHAPLASEHAPEAPPMEEQSTG